MTADDKRIQAHLYEVWKELNGGFDLSNDDGRFLYEQVEQRDKTIAELIHAKARLADANIELEQQIAQAKRDAAAYRHGSELYRWKYRMVCEELNALRREKRVMLSALERIGLIAKYGAELSGFAKEIGDIVTETITQVTKGGDAA